MFVSPRVPAIFPIFLITCLLLGTLSLLDIGLALYQQIFFTGAAVLLLGMPHGALDVLMLNDTSQKLRQATRLPKLALQIACYGVYLVMVVCAFSVWLVLPAISLSLFLIIAAWHFQQDWSGFEHYSTRMAISSLVVTLPSVGHSAQLIHLFHELGLSIAQAQTVTVIMQGVAFLCIAALIHSVMIKRLAIKEVPSLLAVVIAGLALPPLLFFVAYFCGLHSILHTLLIKQRCQLHWKRLIKLLLMPMAATLGLLVLAYVNLAHHNTDWGAVLNVIFIGLFAVTVPHVTLTWLYQHVIVSSQTGSADTL